VAAQYVLADTPLATFLEQQIVRTSPTKSRALIVDTHDRAAFAPIAHLTVGGLPRPGPRRRAHRSAPSPARARRHAGDGAAVAKISGLKDLMVMRRKCAV